MPLPNTDLIGQTFRNGPDGVTRYTVTEVDKNDPHFVRYENKSLGKSGWAIAEFVRLAIRDELYENMVVSPLDGISREDAMRNG